MNVLSKFWVILLSVFSVNLVTTPLFAHPGGLDAYGCHNDRKHGGYHCHAGPLAGQSFTSKADMLAASQGGGASRTTRRQGRMWPLFPQCQKGLIRCAFENIGPSRSCVENPCGDTQEPLPCKPRCPTSFPCFLCCATTRTNSHWRASHLHDHGAQRDRWGYTSGDSQRNGGKSPA